MGRTKGILWGDHMRAASRLGSIAIVSFGFISTIILSSYTALLASHFSVQTTLVQVGRRRDGRNGRPGCVTGAPRARVCVQVRDFEDVVLNDHSVCIHGNVKTKLFQHFFDEGKGSTLRLVRGARPEVPLHRRTRSLDPSHAAPPVRSMRSRSPSRRPRRCTMARATPT